ncbi:MAG: metalloregulator ArsR/SmtB family transcription factor [Dehalococcoidia bacterium]
MPELSRLFKALSDDTRLRMLTLLLPGELCVCEIMQALSVSQSRASRNLGILRDAGLLKDRRQGQWVYYSLDGDTLASYPRLLEFLQRNLGRDGATEKQQGGKETREAVCL